MQKKIIIILLIIVFSITILFLILPNILYQPSTYSCPGIFAKLSYKPVSGITFMLKLCGDDVSRYEFVIPPNSTGVLAVNYYSEMNNLSSNAFSETLYPWKVDVVNNRIDLNASSHVIVKPIKIVVTSIHNITVYYLIDTRNIEPDTYEVCIIPFPSTCLEAVLVVGDKPYYGPFPWEGHVYA